MVDFPSAVNAPGAGTYIPPNVNLAPLLMSLPQSYYQGEEQARQSKLKNMYANGVPRDANGNMDLDKVAEQYLRLGEVGQVVPLINASNQMKLDPMIMSLMAPHPQGAQPQYGQPIPQQQPQGDVSPGFGGYKPPGQSAGTTGSAGASNDASLAPQGTVLALASRVYGAGGELTPQVSNSIAARIGVSPTDKLTPPQAQQAAQLLREQMNGGEAAPTAQPRPAPQSGPQPPQQVAQAAQPSAQPPSAPPGYYPSVLPPGLNDEAQRLFLGSYLAARSGASKEQVGAILERAKVEADRTKAPPDVLEWTQTAPRRADGTLMPFPEYQAYKKQVQETPEMAKARESGVASPLAYETEKQRLDALVKRSEKTYDGINGASRLSSEMRPYLDVSRAILNDPSVYTGVGGDMSLLFNRVKAAAGGDTRAATLQEALQKVTATSVLSQINQQRAQLTEMGGSSGRIFQSQVQLVEKAAPTLHNTIQGNRVLVETASRVGRMSEDIADQARSYMAAHHGILDEGFDQQVSDHMKRNPLFSKKELSDIPKYLGAPTVNSPEEAVSANIDPGTTFRGHDGKYYTVPSQQKPRPNGAVAQPSVQM